MCSLRIELWLARRLGRPGLFEGQTSRDERRERLRHEILARDLAAISAGKKNGVPRTFSDVFEELYSEPLERTECL